MTENEPRAGLPPDSHTDVTASEVASYAYCAKAWHLRYVLRREPSGQAVAHQQARVASLHQIPVLRRRSCFVTRSWACAAGLIISWNSRSQATRFSYLWS